MKLTPIVDDGFEDDTAPSTPYLARKCAVTGHVWRLFLSAVRWIAARARQLRLALGPR